MDSYRYFLMDSKLAAGSLAVQACHGIHSSTRGKCVHVDLPPRPWGGRLSRKLPWHA
jgi:hypothetical protein